jgi:Methylase involved in ubiquinone/menaquinone biosynthesis
MHVKMKEVTFGERADKYDAGMEGKFLKKFYDSMEQFVKVKKGDKLLDAACGTGAILERFKDKGIEGYGIDIDDRMLQVARGKLPGMDFTACSCDAMLYDNEYFNVITVNMAYHHFNNKKGFAKECLRTLKKNGDLYIAEFHIPGFMRKMFNAIFKCHHVEARFFSIEELKKDFESWGFIYDGSMKNGRVQIIKLKKCPN